MSSSWDCPMNLHSGDEIEVSYMFGAPMRMEVKQVIVWSGGHLVECVDPNAGPGYGPTGTNYCFPLKKGVDYRWRRVTERTTLTAMKAYPAANTKFGVGCGRCGQWCPDAEAVSGFKCYSCRSLRA
jgi:hypothetical protein